MPVSAIVLAGGIGQRLRPMTDHFPKPLAHIAGRPMLEHVLYGLRQGGVGCAAVATGYMADRIEACFGNGDALEMELRYFEEDRPLGSGGAVRNVAGRVAELVADTFIVATADVLHSVDLKAALQTHRASGAVATIVCGLADDPSGLGIVEVEEDGRVRRFLEKPAPGLTESRWGNLALWIFEPELLSHLESGYSRIETDLFPRLLANGAPLMAHRHPGYWLDVGTLRRYVQSQTDALLGRFPCDLKLGAGDILDRQNALLIRDGARISSETKLESAIVGPGTGIEHGAEVYESVVYAGARIGAGAKLRGCVVGPDYFVGAGSQWTDTMLFHEAEGDAE